LSVPAINTLRVPAPPLDAACAHVPTPCLDLDDSGVKDPLCRSYAEQPDAPL